MICPACITDTLSPIALVSDEKDQGGMEVDTCANCSGMWFNANALSQFLESSKLKTKFVYDAAQRRNEANFTINTTARVCPKCKVDMEDRLFGGVTLDRCGQCQGLWFDGGELGVVISRYRKGAHGDREIAHELRAGLGAPDAVEGQDEKKEALLDSVRDFLASIELEAKPGS